MTTPISAMPNSVLASLKKLKPDETEGGNGDRGGAEEDHGLRDEVGAMGGVGHAGLARWRREASLAAASGAR
jgi:hypothetical protein